MSRATAAESVIVRCYDAGVRDVGRRTAVGLLWLLAVIALAFGSAGIVAAMANQPGTEARPELTWVGDEALRPGLADAATDLGRIAGDVEALGELGRAALTAIVSRDEASLARVSDEGTILAASIGAESEALRGRLEELPGLGQNEELRISAGPLARRAALIDALEATDGLRGAWALLVSGGLAATRLTTLLEGHDPQAASGAALGRSAKYAEAVTAIDAAIAMLDAATVLRDDLAIRVDVTILDEWIKRNRAYDIALRELYVLLGASGGRVTDEIRAAFVAEETARGNLPPDTRGLVVIMAEIGRGGLNQAVIAIERARGRLSLALEDVATTPAR